MNSQSLLRRVIVAAAAAFSLTQCSPSFSQNPLPSPRLNPALGTEQSVLFSDPRPVTIQGYNDIAAMEPFISRDGKYLFFNNSNEKPGTDTMIYYATRIDDLTFKIAGAVEGIHAPGVIAPEVDAAAPSMDNAGNFYLSTNRDYKRDLPLIYSGHFRDGVVTGLAPVSGLRRSQPRWFTMDGEISADWKTFYCSENVAGDRVSLLMAAAKNADGSFTRLPNSDELFKNINNGDMNYAPAISRDQLELFFTRVNPKSPETSGIYLSRRSSVAAAFGIPQLVVSAVDGFAEAPSISPDGRHLYYARKTGSDSYGFAINVVTRRQ